MKRNIKFRGKHKDMGKWLYGDLVRNVKGAFAIVPPYQMNMNNVYSNFKVDESTVGQFTGLYDKNKKEIYEEDILSLNHNGSNYLVVVEWNNEVGAWCTRFETERFVGVKPLGEWLCDYSMEVIGSIHENLSLLT